VITDKLLKAPVYVNILIVLALLFIVGWLTLLWIDTYTNHNKAVVVPDVRGLQIEEAEPYFSKNLLRYVIIDSVYSKAATPGAIVDIIPDANTKVKKNRIVYVTVNAKSEETAPVPEITDISYRQAYALLKSRGFQNVDLKYVSGEFRDLAIGVEYRGKMVKTGDRIPLASKISLVLSDGHIVAQGDSIKEDKPKIIGGNETWF
jgi:beta-lactam-binding protein with PASTA domain